MKNLKNTISLIIMALTIVTSVKVNAQNPENRNNEFDQVGVLHNELVERAISEHTGKNLSLNEICNIFEDYVNQSPEAREFGANKIDTQLIEDGVNDFPNQFRNVIKSINISTKAQTKAQELIDRMFEMAFADKEPNYSDVYNYVIAFETSIVSDKSLSSNDKKALLSGASIARYSTLMWKNHYSEKYNNTTSKRKRRWWEWVVIGVADVAGGIGGSSVGATVGGAAAASYYTGEIIDGGK